MVVKVGTQGGGVLGGLNDPKWPTGKIKPQFDQKKKKAWFPIDPPPVDAPWWITQQPNVNTPPEHGETGPPQLGPSFGVLESDANGFNAGKSPSGVETNPASKAVQELLEMGPVVGVDNTLDSYPGQYPELTDVDQMYKDAMDKWLKENPGSGAVQDELTSQLEELSDSDLEALDIDADVTGDTTAAADAVDATGADAVDATGAGADAGGQTGDSWIDKFLSSPDIMLRSGTDQAALRTWLLSLPEGAVISRIQDNGNGEFEAFEIVDGKEVSLGKHVVSISDIDLHNANMRAAQLALEAERSAQAEQRARDRLSLDGEISRGRLENETERLDLDRQIQEERLKLDEAMARIDQDIARDRIQHEQEIANGNWQNALDVQDRIDERERAGRQLERDMFNANQELQNRKFELERASFDLDKLEFFQQLSASPANFADLFNISRGLAPTGAGGPMPQGISRIGQSDVQQTAAQDFRSTGINMAPNINTGALPQLGAEQAVPKFSPEQTQLSFKAGGDPTPVDSSGVSTVPAVPFNEIVNPTPITEDVELIRETATDTPTSLQPVDAPQPAPISNISAPVTGSNVDRLQTISDPNAVAQTAEDVVQGAPLPPGLQMAFNQQLTGAPQTAQQSIPLLSPQALNQLTPAEREVYFGLAQMQGQYLPDFQNLLAARSGSRPVSDTQRVFV